MKNEKTPKEISESPLKEFNHTPEPWAVANIPDIMNGMYEIYNKPFGLGIIGYSHNKEDAKRISECVNAMKGIENPIKFMEVVNSMLTMIDNGEKIDNHSLIFKCTPMWYEKTKEQ